MPQDMRRNNQNEKRREDFANLEEIKSKIPQAMSPEKDSEGTVFFHCVEEIGKYLAFKKVTVSQLRKIYSETRRIKSEHFNDAVYRLRMLKAILAYTAGRMNNLREFKDIMSIAIDETIKNKDSKSDKIFKRFIDFVEAIIAYHRAYGGRE
ncbi:MAG: type III-A CRISPR-associated protein Csm2 [Tepidanaerobacteraceae bacterium]|jgi:CRISPR-associated protein Csm2|nr:type III-A CRISPR-associated protein Csm2 [Tepidanaerobacteraceae bacterium]